MKKNDLAIIALESIKDFSKNIDFLIYFFICFLCKAVTHNISSRFYLLKILLNSYLWFLMIPFNIPVFKR